MTTSRVIVIDDHPIVRQGISRLLDAETDFELVGEGTSGEEGLAAAERTKPDIVVLDLRLPDALGPEVCRQLSESLPDTKVVILTAFDDVPLLRACLQAGASAVLLKDVHEYGLVESLREVRGGHTIVDDRIADSGGPKKVLRDAEGHVYEGLTEREHEVLRLLACGMTSREIADELYLSPNTVRSYTQSLLGKLQAHNRIQALATARRLHLI